MSNLSDQPKLIPGTSISIDIATRLYVGIFCLFVAMAGLALYRNLWILDEDGLSIISGTTPYWDFNNLWVGSKLALQGNVESLFNVDIYRAEMDGLLGIDVPDQEWSYPPNMLMVGAPLATMPILPAYLLWIIGSIALLHFALRLYKLPTLAHIAILFSPAVFISTDFGQNGVLIMAMILAALALLPKRPVLAGVIIGLLTIKPQFGILIPFILIASGNWKAFAAASITALTLAILTGIFFGFSSWAAFFSETQPMMKEIMEAPYRQSYQTNAVTVFISIRALGASLAVAYGVQIIVSLACLIYCIRLWHKNNPIQHELRVAITCLLIILVTPYAYTYDLVGVCAAIGIFYVSRSSNWIIPILGIAWMFPLFNHIIVHNVNFNFGGLILTLLLIWMLWHVHKPQKDLLTSGA